MEIIILASLLGLIPGAIAHGKGHSFIAWWFFGALIFIVALPCALFLKPNTRRQEQEQLRNGMKKCPACAELVKQEATICRYCNRPV